jgi:Mrp family chromosome partitioning ATPase
VLGVFFLIGSVDQRTFAIRQLKMDHGQFHCLGVVPDTSKASSEPEILNIGMNCVHKLRNRIESIRFRKPDTGYIMLISSPFQGDGKTTLVQLLGHSYAAAGFRTCLVDCDFIGRSLSHSLNMLDKRGLKEVVKEGALDDKLVELDRDNLFLLPIGLDEMVNPEMMQIDVVEELFAELRGKFDFIIIDTGPLSGSIESMPIAGSVDGVILALRKGRSRVPLKRCVRDLHQLNAPYLGVVLNYADKSDYKDIASVSKSIEQVIEEEATGVRKRNALTESLNNKSKRSRS